MYTLEILKGKKYRKVYAGKLSQCYKRLPSLYDRWRIKSNGEVIAKRV